MYQFPLSTCRLPRSCTGFIFWYNLWGWGHWLRRWRFSRTTSWSTPLNTRGSTRCLSHRRCASTLRGSQSLVSRGDNSVSRRSESKRWRCSSWCTATRTRGAASSWCPRFTRLILQAPSLGFATLTSYLEQISIKIIQILLKQK